MTQELKSKIEIQRLEVFKNDHFISLKRACTLNDGIIVAKGLNELDLSELDISFFIPASGSGSRMFSFLYTFLNTGVESTESQKFFDHLSDFPFVNEIPDELLNPSSVEEKKKLAEYIVGEEGLDFGALPKGLIPFNSVEDLDFNPFQLHCYQVNALLGSNAKIHFTIQKGFEREILNSIADLDLDLDISFSVQDPESNAYCFDDKEEVVFLNGKELRRPAGHGALLSNLNAIDANFVLIKNIDNVQSNELAEPTIKAWNDCLTIITEFKADLKKLHEDHSPQELKALNEKYQLSDGELTEAELSMLFKRPTRVCGMVENTGAPGGGPFWIKGENIRSKQIVEKVQIAEKDFSIVQQSSHFNPVFIVLDKTDVYGNLLDLTEFVDDSKAIVVKKTQEGQEINYRELPGLWNGAMDNYNTIFVELPKEVFTPVKTVLDLIER